MDEKIEYDDMFEIETLQEGATEVLDEAVALAGGSSNSSNNTAEN